MPSCYSSIQSWPYNFETLEEKNGYEFPKSQKKNSCDWVQLPGIQKMRLSHVLE